MGVAAELCNVENIEKNNRGDYNSSSLYGRPAIGMTESLKVELIA